MTGLPFRSKLAPYEHEIVELRRQRPPVSYREIVRRLKERYDVTVTINGPLGTLFVGGNLEAGATVRAQSLARNEIQGQTLGTLVIG